MRDLIGLFGMHYRAGLFNVLIAGRCGRNFRAALAMSFSAASGVSLSGEASFASLVSTQ